METCQLCKDSRTVITLSSMEQVKFLFGTETEELGRKRNDFGGRHSHSTNLLENETRSTVLQIFEYSNSTRCGRLGLGRLQRGNALSFRLEDLHILAPGCRDQWGCLHMLGIAITHTKQTKKQNTKKQENVDS